MNIMNSEVFYRKYIEKDFINTDKIENKKSSVDELIDLMGENIIEYK